MFVGTDFCIVPVTHQKEAIKKQASSQPWEKNWVANNLAIHLPDLATHLPMYALPYFIWALFIFIYAIP